jgi:hypothetical protein
MLWLAACTGGEPADVAKPPAEDGAVTAGNLLAHERYWPYQVSFRAPWKPAGRVEPILPGTLGVLIRVEHSAESGSRAGARDPGVTARIDFGRDGVVEVPVGETDLVERGNRIRTGELEKDFPNFVLAMGPRLIDPNTAAPMSVRVAQGHRGFLCVFADPSAADFPELASALAPLRDRLGVLTALFPQGEIPDLFVLERLRSVGWEVAFSYDYLSEPYTRSLLPDGLAPPAVMLHTAEGRVLFRSRWDAGVLPGLEAALDQAFGVPARATAQVDREP